MGETQFITVGWLVDGSGGSVRRKVYLAVKNGYISAIGPIEDLPCKEGDMVHDLSHCTILPALVDCSVSLARSTSVNSGSLVACHGIGLDEKLVLIKQHLRDCHVHGVQGIADNEGISELLERYTMERAQMRLLEIRVPERPDQNSQREDKPATCDFRKIHFSRNIDAEDSTYPALNHDDLYRVLQVKDGQKTVVVANGRQQVHEAIAAGCDAIEQGYDMGEDNLKQMAEKDVLWIPSVLRAKNSLDNAGTSGEVCCRFSQRYVAPGKPVPGAEALWKKILAKQLAQLSFARDLGVTTAVGTGAGSVGILHGESMVEEMKLFIKAGYTLEETIRCASENGARFFNMERLGALAVGRRANFLVTRGTIKQLPRKLAYLEGVYVNGEPSAEYNKNPVKMMSEPAPL